MHILFTSPHYPSAGNPFTAFVAAFCEEAARQGHHITVVAPLSLTSHLKHRIPIPPRHERVAIGAGIEVFRPRCITFGEGRQLLRQWSARVMEHYIGRTVRRKGIHPDMIYGKFFPHSLECAPLARRMGVPLVVDCGEDVIQPEHHFAPRRLRRALAEVSGVVCVSAKNRAEVLARGLASAGRTRTFVNGYNPAHFHPMDRAALRRELGWPQEAFVVIFCGRFNHRKGARRVEEAVRSLADPEVRTVYLGRPVEGESWRPTGREVLFSGVVPHERMARYLCAADLYVFPTLMEGCPNTTIEAMACGLPVVSSDRPFNADILGPDNAILLDPEDVPAIARAIAALKADPERRSRMAEASLARAAGLTIEARVRGIMKFAEELKANSKQ